MTAESLRQEEEQLRKQVAELSSEQKKQYYALEVAQVKDPDTYAVLNWAFLAGLHHFYLGRWQRGLLNLVLMLIGGLFYFSQLQPLLGGAMILLVFIIELPQLFNSQNIIHSYNNQLMQRLLKQVRGEQ
ncbi:MAG: TM2 domain-containing protein [Colwellia sp.]|nr:TM2 domain-containing protein [Colwellia sp.]